MNITIVSLFALCGIIMGALSVFGFTYKIEPFLWLVFALAAALVMSKNLNDKFFLHAITIGLLWAVLNGLIQSMFFDRYFLNNPHLQSAFSKPSPIPARFMSLVFSPVIGGITGVVLWLITLLFKKLLW